MDVLPRSERPVLVQWLLDTRNLWPEATQTRQLETVAARALAVLLTDEERAGVLKYFHVRDAKMALGSLLLKHLAVARAGGVYWDRSVLTRDARSKPVYCDAATGAQPVAFNVSHQAGLVLMAAVYGGGGGGRGRPDAGRQFEVGVDVVSPGERRDRDHLMVAGEGEGEGGGWGRFVDMHADVLAPGEVQHLKYHVLSTVPPELLPGRTSGGGTMASTMTVSTMTTVHQSPPAAAADLLDLKLRCFYTLWCLREAYVKMTGEALLAPWLGELEFRQFRPPPPLPPPLLSSPAASTDLRQDPAAMVTRHDIRFRGRPVSDDDGVVVCLRALGDDYMACTAVRSLHDPAAARALPIVDAFAVLELDEVLSFAERFRQPAGR